MIHSKNKSGEDIKGIFVWRFENKYAHICLSWLCLLHILILLHESELCDWGVNIIIYANHMLRAAYLL